LENEKREPDFRNNELRQASRLNHAKEVHKRKKPFKRLQSFTSLFIKKILTFLNRLWVSEPKIISQSRRTAFIINFLLLELPFLSFPLLVNFDSDTAGECSSNYSSSSIILYLDSQPLGFH